MFNEQGPVLAGMPSHRTSPSLADVARISGVSVGSASRILNDSPGFRASVAVRTRVREVAQRLGYQPDPVGRALRTKRSQVIGLLGVWSEMFGEDQVVNQAIIRASSTLFAAGYDVIAGMPKPGHPRFRLGSAQMDGALLLIPGENETLGDIEGSGMPYVSLDGPAGEHGVSLLLDDIDATEQIVGHLLKRGHRRIAWWSAMNYDHHSLKDRMATFHRMVAEADAVACPVPVTGDPAICLESCRAARVTAVLVYGAKWAMDLCRTVADAGLQIPGDLAIATYNHSPASERLGLTTIAWPHAEMGARGAHLLVEQLAGRCTDWRTHHFKGQLTIGTSA